ncbi:hypothetical protein CcCBS67573_g06768 [Chytriomyces confervae]|uniref:THH1/TOM1/TOM3 domain-containing protein n=1 Tax=Chytriomyces confervae TaxID=246404 RepID=A0A507F2V1_9FUNG|nr:hypothetical protein HDU80_004250 [Chytriomyces hyalinus]TPX69718.1 hypothetical protein CcCBS67573_g06768 [Chytriomyces confervae]
MDADTLFAFTTTFTTTAEAITAADPTTTSAATSLFTAATATATSLTHTATAVATVIANSSATSIRPAPILNYASTVQWSSVDAAYIFMAITVLMTIATVRNLIYSAKSKHTKMIYMYLLFWCIFRVAAFAVRGYILTDDRGQDFTLYKWASIISSVGFMPLAEVLAFCTLEGTALAYGFTNKTRSRFDLFVKALFATFGTTVTAFAIDFTCNKPFGSNPKDYPIDIVLREIGFNGLLLITIYTLFGSIRNMVAVVPHAKVPAIFVSRFRVMMIVVCFQSILMLVKLVYTTYRNWNPFQLRDEGVWYILSIAPEYVFVLFYLNHGFLKVYDDIERFTLDSDEDEDHVKSKDVVDAQHT